MLDKIIHMDALARWGGFVAAVRTALQGLDEGCLSLDRPFQREQDCTAAIALGLRELFARHYPDVPDDPSHVVAREGLSEADRRSWKEAVADKWIDVHGVRFVPDVLIRHRVGDTLLVLPIEVKFIRKSAGASQAMATAIGQAVAYVTRYPEAIVFIGVQRGLGKGRRAKRRLIEEGDVERKLKALLGQQNIHIIIREVGSV